MVQSLTDIWTNDFLISSILSSLHRWIKAEEATATSDAAVWSELEPLTPYAIVHLKRELEELLHRPLDLVRLRERMNSALRQAILREEISA